MKYCDLHTHSTASDGTATPAELAALARQAKLAAIALTDHDTTAGLLPCAEACKKAKIDFVPGIELSVDPQSFSQGTAETARRGTMHILGLFIEPTHAGLVDIQQQLIEAREERNPQIITNLNKLGVRIAYEEVVAVAGGQVVGRPHIAQVMLKKGYVKSIQDAFSRYIGEGAVAYARKDRLSAGRAIEVVHEAGGLAILAHPVQLRCAGRDELTHLVTRMKDLGLDGVETRHSDHTPADVEAYEALAANLELLTTGGSDYHGSRKSIELGSQKIPYSVYEKLKEAHLTLRK